MTRIRVSGVVALVLAAGAANVTAAVAQDGRVFEWRWAEEAGPVIAGDSIYARATRNARAAAAAQAPVFGNADLERLAQGPPFATEPVGPAAAEAATAPEGAAVPSDVLDGLKRAMLRSAERERSLTEAEHELEAARAALANLEVQLLATRNPFSRRPWLSREEIAYRRLSGETASQRYERTLRLVEDARQRVVDAKLRLAELQAERAALR